MTFPTEDVSAWEPGPVHYTCTARGAFALCMPRELSQTTTSPMCHWRRWRGGGASPGRGRHLPTAVSGVCDGLDRYKATTIDDGPARDRFHRLPGPELWWRRRPRVLTGHLGRWLRSAGAVGAGPDTA